MLHEVFDAEARSAAAAPDHAIASRLAIAAGQERSRSPLTVPVHVVVDLVQCWPVGRLLLAPTPCRAPPSLDWGSVPSVGVCA